MSLCTTIMMYAFILGRNHQLSLAELGSFFGSKISAQGGVAFFEGMLPAAKPQDFLNRLGGTTEIVEIFARAIPVGAVQIELEKYFKKVAAETSGKFSFAINEVPEKRQSRMLKFLLPRTKKSLRAVGVSANFMNKGFKNVSAVFAAENHLARRGTNVSIIDEGAGRVSLGFSVAMQDFEGYSKRDFSKPFRDANVGMLPPKLAQIMINLSSGVMRPASCVIVDPFCGTGTILMEALLGGHSAIGCDAEARMVAGAQKNVEWLRKNCAVSAAAQSKIFHKNATAILKNDLPDPPLAIATEPHLGPPLSTFPAQAFLNKVQSELQSLYLAFFKNLAPLLTTGTRVVFIFPYWKNGRNQVRLAPNLIEKISALGYSVTTFDPLHEASLFYDRPDSIVGREIVRFVRR